ncbi:polyprenol monophosphomannose synthase [Propionibacteriaceae bacterium G57]|uniref:polyprenol monophosphomannose synthase n=1 Tax=Aestuariimicrobium sp. G57 TaxID=3418485 RepID=UPI003DA6DA98
MSDDLYPGLGKVLVIIPTYNEVENIEPIVKRLRSAVPQAHVLIADDNSPDGTGQLADQLASDDDHVHVNHRKGKEGLGAAYLDSFNWGLEHGYDVLVEHDADGSHQPEQLPRLLNALAGGADMVKGSRWVKGGSIVNWPKSREFLSRGGSVYIQLMLGMPIKDVTGGLNAFKADVLHDIIADGRIDRHGYGIQRDLTWNAYQKGYSIVEVPIDFIERERGDSKMGSHVVVEAIKSTTKMGVQHRLGQLKGLLDKLRGRKTLGTHS